MSVGSTPLLFVHGYWHGSWCWSEVTAPVAGMGRPAAAVDLAGHGLRAGRPHASPDARSTPRPWPTRCRRWRGVDLDQAGDLLVSQIKEVRRGGPVTVVAHSMGGLC